jgi:hypothetical protein
MCLIVPSFGWQHGGVRIGDVLIALNDTQLHDCPFNDVSPHCLGPWLIVMVPMMV